MSPKLDALKLKVNQFPDAPGVYRFLNYQGDVLYVGKARRLKARVKSYFQANPAPKTAALVASAHDVVFTITHSENEALILEWNLIKQYLPRYNVLLRDDKSYPFIYLSTQHDFPRIRLHRGAQKGKGKYFGPYPNAMAARKTIYLLQKLFKIRPCSDSFFKYRSRPCLQYQIKRCTAPCVDYISVENYKKDIKHVMLFLEGKNQSIINDLTKAMEQAASSQHYEQAAFIRDKIIALQAVQKEQSMQKGRGDIDVVAIVFNHQKFAVCLMEVRGGSMLGAKHFYPKAPAHSSTEEVLTAFLTQYYLNHKKRIPAEIILSEKIDDADMLKNTLSQLSGHNVKITFAVKTHRATWLMLARKNATEQLMLQFDKQKHVMHQFTALKNWLNLPTDIALIVCFDISHTQGEHPVASQIAYTPAGPCKRAYRKFNLSGIKRGDDYAALHQAFTRYFKGLLENADASWPDLVLIDGGKGQLSQAQDVLKTLNISGVLLLSIAKGPKRIAGEEDYFLPGNSQPLKRPKDTGATLLLQAARDEAHRFALAGHRAKRKKQRTTSPLENIPGVGPKRRREILQHLGGWQEVYKATAKELARVPGISYALAERIYHELHGA